MSTDKLERNLPDFELDEVQALTRELYGIRGEFSAQESERDQSWKVCRDDGETLVVKIANAAEREDIVEFQVRALEHIAASNLRLPVPRMIASAEGRPYEWIESRDGERHMLRALSFLPGDPVDTRPDARDDRMRYALGDVLVYGPLRNVLGMSRVRVAYTAGEAIGPDLFKFYRSIGINLKQLYGSTETSVFVCIQPNGQVKADTVGLAVPGVELKFTPQRELLIRSPGLFREYYKNPQATLEAKDPEGWFRTGDAGYVDQDGHLKIIDRVKDVGALADGTLFAPKYLENKLKFFPYVQEAVAFGDRRTQVCAFINIDMEAVGNWAERQNMPYSGYTDLASRDEIYDLVRECVEKVNADLAQEPELANSQIHRFLILHKALDADDEELTRTRKVRRGFVAEKYAPLVDALYSGKDSVHIEAKVRYEDGRTGSISADLKIRDAKTFAPAAAKKAA